MSAMDVPAEGASDRAAEKAVARRKAVNYISWIALALMTTSSVASLRPAPTMAVYGLACIFLYVVPAIIFLLPTSLVSAELASGYEGGVYNWVARGISKPMGFLAVWCQFAMTIFYYPTLLGFVASTLAYVINPELASSGVWTAIVIVVVYWTGVWVSSRGTKGVAGLASGGLIIGTLIPGAVLVILGAVFLGQGNPSAAPMTASNLLPAWAGLASLVLIVNNFLSYSGMEMNAVHVSSLREPGKEFPKAIFFASGLVMLIFILPALAISWVVPAEQLSLTAGIMQAFEAIFANFGIAVADPDLRPDDSDRLAGRDVDLAGRSVERLAAHLAAGGIPAAVPAEDEQERGSAEHLGRPGCDHDPDRVGIRFGPDASRARTGSSR